MSNIRYSKKYERMTKIRLKLLSLFFSNTSRFVFMPRHHCKKLKVASFKEMFPTSRSKRRPLIKTKEKSLIVVFYRAKIGKYIKKCYYSISSYSNVMTFYGSLKQNCSSYLNGVQKGSNETRCRLTGVYTSVSANHVRILTYEGYAGFFRRKSDCLAILKKKKKS
jgi:hypothetical protein